jgi:hypothetical protein
MQPSRPPPPPPPKDLFFDFASKKQELKAIEPEELTELLDDDLEQWASGGTRILPKSMSPASLAPQSQSSQPPPSQMQSFPPVAFAPSYPPPAARAGGSAVVWAAVIGMTTVFAIAAVVGLVFLVRSQSDASSDTTQASDTVTTTTTDTTEVAAPIATTTVDTAAPIATLETPTRRESSHVTAPAIVTAAPARPQAQPQGQGTLQTFAIATGRPIFVDGKQIGVGGGHLKTTCGRHSISVGAARARNVDVPCNGTITVGTPDGT